MKNVWRSRMDSRAQIQSFFFFWSNYPNHPTPTPPPPLTTPKYKFCQFCSNLDETWCGSKEWIAKLKSRFILFIWLPQITPTTLSPTPLTQLKILTKMGKSGTWNGRVGGLKWRYWGPEMDELGAWNGQVGGLKWASLGPEMGRLGAWGELGAWNGWVRGLKWASWGPEMGESGVSNGWGGSLKRAHQGPEIRCWGPKMGDSGVWNEKVKKVFGQPKIFWTPGVALSPPGWPLDSGS